MAKPYEIPRSAYEYKYREDDPRVKLSACPFDHSIGVQRIKEQFTEEKMSINRS